MNIEWTDERPTKFGYYVFKQQGFKRMELIKVHVGNWQERQDPRRTYGNDCLLIDYSDINAGVWFGPIPECNEVVENRPTVDLK